jgi:hypothetical protein
MELHSEQLQESNFRIYPPIGIEKLIKDIKAAISSGIRRILLVGGTGYGKSIIAYNILCSLGYEVKYINCAVDIRNQKNILDYLKKLRCGYSIQDLVNGRKKKFGLLIDDMHFFDVYPRNTILENIPGNIITIATMNPPVETKFSTNFPVGGIFEIPELPKACKSRIIDQLLGDNIKFLSKKKRDEILENQDISEIIKFCDILLDSFKKKGTSKEITVMKNAINELDISKEKECIDYDMKTKIRMLLRDKMPLPMFCSIFETDSFVFQNLFIQNLCNILRNNRNTAEYETIYRNIIQSNKYNQIIPDINYTAIISYYQLNGRFYTDEIENNNKINNILAAKSNFKNITDNVQKQYPILADDFLKLNSPNILNYIYFKLKELSSDDEFKTLLKELKDDGKIQELYEIIYFDTQNNTKFKSMIKNYT